MGLLKMYLGIVYMAESPSGINTFVTWAFDLLWKINQADFIGKLQWIFKLRLSMTGDEIWLKFKRNSMLKILEMSQNFKVR